jgi:nicotinate dehydrogenase subunit A
MTAFSLNGAAVVARADDTTPLLHVLRGEFALNGPRHGCGEEACGACHVLLDGRSVPSCALPVGAVVGREVVTLEGLGTRAAPHPVQAALIEEQAGQCGFCLSGIVVTAAALLRETPRPSEDQVREALAPHLCRCYAHNRIIRAVMRAAA